MQKHSDRLYTGYNERGGSMSKLLIELKGTNGTVSAYEDRVVISRKGFFAFATQGFKGDRVYFYNDLSGVDYKKPGLVNGYIKFIVAGTKDINPKVGIFKTSTDSANDENTVILRAFNRKIPEQSEQLYNLIMQRITVIKQGIRKDEKEQQIQADAISQLERLAKLKDLGVITESEFNKKKQELLKRV